MGFWKSFLRSNFKINKQLAKRKVPSRATAFVLVPDTPTTNTAYLTNDTELRQTEEANCELINMGENTLLTLIAQKKAGICPRVIFFRSINPEESSKISKEYLIETYIESIKNENQRPIEFHIAAHGTSDSIGFYIKDSLPLVLLGNTTSPDDVIVNLADSAGSVVSGEVPSSETTKDPLLLEILPKNPR